MSSDAHLVCPCCQHPIDGDRLPAMALKHVRFTYIQQRIVDALVEAWPRGLSKHALVEAAYFDDPNGGPDAAENTITTHICHIRTKLPRYGWYIPVNCGGQGNRARYRLEAL